jgi:hypothetical protein
MVLRANVETIIEEDGGKQADLEGEAGIELVDDLPWGETSFVGVRASQVEVELVERGLGKEVGTILESFQVEELVLDEAVDGFDVGLIGVGGRGDALMLRAEVSDGAGEVGARASPCSSLADELAAVVPSALGSTLLFRGTAGRTLP